MRISELTTDEGLDVLCEITPFIGAIVTDEELVAELKRKIKLGDDASKAQVWVAATDKLSKLMPIIFKTHRADVYGIIGAINGKPQSEIETQNFIKTMTEIRDIIRDEEFRNFFKSSWNTEQA